MHHPPPVLVLLLLCFFASLLPCFFAYLLLWLPLSNTGQTTGSSQVLPTVRSAINLERNLTKLESSHNHRLTSVLTMRNSHQESFIDSRSNGITVPRTADLTRSSNCCLIFSYAFMFCTRAFYLRIQCLHSHH